MAKPTNRRYKPGELGGMEVTIIDPGDPIVLAQPRIQNSIARAGATTSIGKLGAGTYGAYSPSTRNIILDEKLMNKSTAYHEGGHAIDHKNDWISKQSPFKAGAKGTPAKEWDKILVNRFNRYVVPSDRIKTYAALDRRIGRTYSSYINSSEERFADALSQWRMNPSKFKTYAPTISKWFNDNKGLL